MDRLDVHERIIATEYFLHGCVVDVPKVYDADGRNHTGRAGKGQPGNVVRELTPESVVVETYSRTEARDLIAGLIAGA